MENDNVLRQAFKDYLYSIQDFCIDGKNSLYWKKVYRYFNSQLSEIGIKKTSIDEGNIRTWCRGTNPTGANEVAVSVFLIYELDKEFFSFLKNRNWIKRNQNWSNDLKKWPDYFKLWKPVPKNRSYLENVHYKNGVLKSGNLTPFRIAKNLYSFGFLKNDKVLVRGPVFSDESNCSKSCNIVNKFLGEENYTSLNIQKDIHYFIVNDNSGNEIGRSSYFNTEHSARQTVEEIKVHFFIKKKLPPSTSNVMDLPKEPDLIKYYKNKKYHFTCNDKGGIPLLFSKVGFETQAERESSIKQIINNITSDDIWKIKNQGDDIFYIIEINKKEIAQTKSCDSHEEALEIKKLISNCDCFITENVRREFIKWVLLTGVAFSGGFAGWKWFSHSTILCCGSGTVNAFMKIFKDSLSKEKLKIKIDHEHGSIGSLRDFLGTNRAFSNYPILFSSKRLEPKYLNSLNLVHDNIPINLVEFIIAQGAQLCFVRHQKYNALDEITFQDVIDIIDINHSITPEQELVVGKVLKGVEKHELTNIQQKTLDEFVKIIENSLLDYTDLSFFKTSPISFKNKSQKKIAYEKVKLMLPWSSPNKGDISGTRELIAELFPLSSGKKYDDHSIAFKISKKLDPRKDGDFHIDRIDDMIATKFHESIGVTREFLVNKKYLNKIKDKSYSVAKIKYKGRSGSNVEKIGEEKGLFAYVKESHLFNNQKLWQFLNFIIDQKTQSTLKDYDITFLEKDLMIHQQTYLNNLKAKNGKIEESFPDEILSDNKHFKIRRVPEHLF